MNCHFSLRCNLATCLPVSKPAALSTPPPDKYPLLKTKLTFVSQCTSLQTCGQLEEKFYTLPRTSRVPIRLELDNGGCNVSTIYARILFREQPLPKSCVLIND